MFLLINFFKRYSTFCTCALTIIVSRTVNDQVFTCFPLNTISASYLKHDQCICWHKNSFFFCKPLSPFFQWTTSRCPATEFSTACMFLGPTRASMSRGTVCVWILSFNALLFSLFSSASAFYLTLPCAPHTYHIPTILQKKHPVLLCHHSFTNESFDTDPTPSPLQTATGTGEVFSRLLSSISCCFPGASDQQIQYLLHLQQQRSKRQSRCCSITSFVKSTSAIQHHPQSASFSILIAAMSSCLSALGLPGQVADVCPLIPSLEKSLEEIMDLAESGMRYTQVPHVMEVWVIYFFVFSCKPSMFPTLNDEASIDGDKPA